MSYIWYSMWYDHLTPSWRYQDNLLFKIIGMAWYVGETAGKPSSESSLAASIRGSKARWALPGCSLCVPASQAMEHHLVIVVGHACTSVGWLEYILSIQSWWNSSLERTAGRFGSFALRNALFWRNLCLISSSFALTWLLCHDGMVWFIGAL